jgi:hypothetical protein
MEKGKKNNRHTPFNFENREAGKKEKIKKKK